ncbi:MAG: membrane-bound dehydrogenase [Planctomycetota bacterium]|nr:MAG: membrane-bound dehydrogenase [Planctomycetota bacterium]
MISRDPWFRPVDLQCGPDGALYILDFYNKIIGHYEVDLKHPGRDRHRGRIWKVIHKATPLHEMPDLRTASREEKVALLGHENLTLRLLTMNSICDSTVPPSKQHSVFRTQDADSTTEPTPHTSEGAWGDRLAELIRSSTNPVSRSHAMWILERLKSPANLNLNFADDPAREDRVHRVKIFAERTNWGDKQNPFGSEGHDAVDLLRVDDDSFVKRAAADAIALHPGDGSLWLAASQVLAETPESDHHLLHVLRFSMRSSLSVPGQFRKLTANVVETAFPADFERASKIALAVNSDEAANFLLAYITRPNQKSLPAIETVHHIARFISPLKVPDLVQFVRTSLNAAHTQQLDLLAVLRKANEQRGTAPDSSIREWAAELAGKLLETARGTSLSWANEVVPGKPKADNPWELRVRVSQDGDKGSLFFDSLVKGEQLTGLNRSEPFELPAKLSFWCAGHNGLPGAPFKPKNFIRLRDASTHALLREAMPPRNDTAQRIEWDLAD